MSQHSGGEAAARVTLRHLRERVAEGGRFACLTAYDATFASLLENAGVEVVLVGDSLGMVIQGHDTTVPVTVEQMIYHSACVARGCRRALLMVDMPFLSYASPQQAVANAGRLMQEGGAQMVKLEGAAAQVEIVAALSAQGIPVCAHLGLRPQSVHKAGGFRVQGRDEAAARQMVEDARLLEQAGADMLLLECIPSPLAETITRGAGVPVIGIGAGPAPHAQVLVLYDLLGITAGRQPRFVKNYLAGGGPIQEAVARFVEEVKSGRYPGPEHAFR
ncbi:MAG TPA: 3-methyl-2-oxobutanoate hydroxymethyltransferase [Thiotrichales bacterium]|nr:3-methyl-2-oxobutanoate hydroxymethyltransferase [Thiotrichales bacterium]